MEGVRQSLEAELRAEQEFVEEARRSETAPKGWPAALLMFHVSMWRELLRDALYDVRAGRPNAGPPEDADEFNDSELANGIGTPLTDAAARSERLLDEITSLYDELGDKEFMWYSSRTTTEAVLRNSYLHPRLHMFQYYRENGELQKAMPLMDEAASRMREMSAPPIVLGVALYNLAAARVADGKTAEAIPLLREAVELKPDLKEDAAEDVEFLPLRQDEDFQALIT